MSLEQLSEQDRLTWIEFIEHLSKTDVRRNFNTIMKQKLDTRLDLHGMTIQHAPEHCRQFIRDHWILGNKTLVIVTGRSGGMAQEFTHWCITWKQWVHHYEPLNDRRGQVGAYKIHLTGSHK